MSIEFKMTRYGSGRKSRLYKKTKRASINRIDATHLPMRVQSEKNGYWGQTSRGRASLPYIKVKKFLLANVGRPVNKVYTEFLASAERIKEYTRVELVDYGYSYEVLTWQSPTYYWSRTYDYFYYVVKIADIEAYKKEKYKP